MAHIVVGKDEILAAWAAKRIAHADPDPAQAFGLYKAVGVFSGATKEARLMAVIVFHTWIEKYGTCEISCVGNDPRWASRDTIRRVLAFPFLQYGANKVWTATPHTAERVIRFNKAIGFRQEGVIREHFGEWGHAVVCGMLAREYRRIYRVEDDHGKEQPLRARSA